MLIVHCARLIILRQAEIDAIKQEMLWATRGNYMMLVEGRRVAEDDEHTEVNIMQQGRKIGADMNINSPTAPRKNLTAATSIGSALAQKKHWSADSLRTRSEIPKARLLVPWAEMAGKISCSERV